tara:strand:+ start:874 stop:1158 length:285 start_codon:yes stop_codon:yes gene_type:complete
MVEVLTFEKFNESYQDSSFDEFMDSLNIDNNNDTGVLEIPSTVDSKSNIRRQLEIDLSKIQKKYESSFQPDSYASIDEMYAALDRMYEKIEIRR